MSAHHDAKGAPRLADGKFMISVPETVSVSTEAVRRLIGSGDGDAALV